MQFVKGKKAVTFSVWNYPAKASTMEMERKAPYSEQKSKNEKYNTISCSSSTNKIVGHYGLSISRIHWVEEIIIICFIPFSPHYYIEAYYIDHKKV